MGCLWVGSITMQQIFDFFSNGFSRLRSMNRRVLYGTIAFITFVLILTAHLALHSRQTTPPIPIALVAPLSGEEAIAGEEMVHSVQMYLDTVNQKGGINGHPLKLLTFDDRADEKLAKQEAPAIVNSPAVVVLGHRSSALSEAGGKVYGAAHLPAITGTANTDTVTLNNPYYFRNTYTRSTLNTVLSVYAKLVLKLDTASVIQYEKYGKKLAQEFESAFIKSGGIIKRKLTIDTDPQRQDQSLQAIVNELAADPNPGIVYFSLRGEEEAEKLLVAIKRRGLKLPIMLGQALAREDFAKRFEQYPEEGQRPGFFTDGIYATSPLLFDSGGVDAQEFADTYQKRYGKTPSYVGTKYYEAAILATVAIRNANLQVTANSRDSDRERVYAALKKINNRNVAPLGPTGSLYFNATRDSDQPVRVAQFQKRVFVSAPQQFETIFNPERVNVQPELQAGTIVQIGNVYFWRQNVVYTGIDINHINQVDPRKSSFTSDFYLWFRYPNGVDPTNIKFPGGTNLVSSQPLFTPDAPLEIDTINGLNYRLYQIRGEFKTPFNLRDYPFDQQDLAIRFQNTTTPRDRLIYVIDTFGLRLHQSNTDTEKKLYQGLQLWKFNKLQYAQEVFRTTSTEGDPRLFGINNRVDYPGLSATVTMQRRSVLFLIKNLLPLFLLTLVPMATFYFPDKISKDRPPVAVAALISGTVLLVGVNNQLPEVGYTVALEYVFYVFFGLSLFAVAIAVVSDRLTLEGYKLSAKRLDYTARIVYVLIVVLTAIVYWVVFGERIS